MTAVSGAAMRMRVRVRREHALWGEARVREVEVGGGGLHASEVGGGGRGFPGGR